MKRITTLIILCVMALSVLHPHTVLAGKNQSLDEIRAVTCNALKGTGNMGVEYYFSFPPCYEESGNNKLMLYLASASKGFATIEVVDKGFKTKVVLTANDCVPVELGPGNGQAFSKPIDGSIPPEQVYPGCAVHITSTVPIVVYAVTRFSYTSDSFMALPVQTLGKDYVVASMADMTWMFSSLSLPSESTITAAYDNTQVEFTLGGPSVTVSGGGMKPGDIKRFSMNKGDVWVIGNNKDSKEGDMTGSVIHASKPVAVVSGNQCANVPTNEQWCDFCSEQELPMNLWGKYLQVPKYASRLQGYFMKVFASQKNTKINYNGKYWRTMQKVGGQEGTGWIYQRVDGTGNNVLSLSADHPIYAVVFNPGQSDDNVSTDPFQMDVMPIEQYQTNVLFCTPGTKGGINFTRNYLGVVFQLDSNQSMPADLEFGISQNGKIKWQTLASKFGPAFSTKDIFQEQVNGKTYAFKECTLGADGVYALRCSTPFMSYNYGGSDYDSYGHPTSGSLTVVSAIPDTLQPIVHYSVACDGSVGVLSPATVTDLPNDTTSSNMSAITLIADSSFNYTLNYDAFEPGSPSSKSVKWSLTVDDPDVDAHALVVFTDRAGNQSCVEVDYHAVNLTIVPNFYNYTATNPAKKGDVLTHDFQIVNKGNSDAIVARLEFKNGGAGVFDIVPKVTLPFTMKAGETRNFTVQYTANNDGYVKDSIGVGDTCVFHYRTQVEATTGAPIINVDDIDFGTVVVNSTNQRTFYVYNQGKVVLNVTGQSGVVPSTAPFVSHVPTDLSNTNPKVLQSANSAGNTDRVQYTVDFNPTVIGSFSGTITFQNDAGTNIKNVCNIKGVATAPGLQVSTVNFGRCRIHRPAMTPPDAHYGGPYSYDYQASGTAYMVLTNTGTQKLTITKAVPNGDASKFTLVGKALSDFIGLDIDVNASVKIPILYTPDSPANDNFGIDFNIANDTTTSHFTAKGVGVVPRVKIDNVDFGSVQLVNGSSKNNHQSFTITNLSQTAWSYADTLHVSDLIDGTGGINDQGTGGSGNQFFSWDRTQLAATGLVVKPGDVSAQFDGYYSPNTVANNTSTLTTVSDAETEGVSTWKGNASGGVLKYTLTVNPQPICFGDSILVSVTIKNVGDSTVGNQSFMSGKFRLSGGPNAEVVLPPDITTPLLCGESVTVQMLLKPASPGIRNYTLVCDATPGPVSVTADFTVTGLSYPSTIMGPVGPVKGLISVDAATNKNYFDFPVSLGANLDAANVKSLTTVIKFKRAYMDLAKDASGNAIVTLNTADGAAKTGWTAMGLITFEPDSTVVTVKLSSTTGTLTGGGTKPLFTLQFQMLLNVTEIPDFGTTGTNVMVYPSMAYSNSSFAPPATCAVIGGSSTKIVTDQVCAYTYNHLVANVSGEFLLKNISPNPVGEAGTKIDFGVGFDAQTRIDIIGTNGEIVSTLVNERLNGGYYSLNFVPTNIASGSYLVRMISNGNSFTQRIQIVK